MIMPGMSTVRTAYGTYSDLGLSLDGHFLKEGGGRGQCTRYVLPCSERGFPSSDVKEEKEESDTLMHLHQGKRKEERGSFGTKRRRGPTAQKKGRTPQRGKTKMEN